MTLHYRNETLFSEIYLEEITRQPEEDHILASLRVLREYRDYADVSSLETWTQSYIHEVFAALGFNHKPKHADLTLLFPMGGTDQPVSLCCVTLPDESLDNTTLGSNWAEKVIRALREQGLQWGLLTNGKSWRIYHVDEATPYETYLEIDLERILSEQAKDAYQIFHKFMKAENFVADEEGKCQFDRFKKESKDKIDYIEKELANALKQREENGKGVLSDLCMGYVDELRQLGGYDLDDDGLRRKIYHGSMLYMFRLLFLFYADARGLLSDENHDLLDSVEADARAQYKGERDSATSYAIWERLAAIFVDIDQTYNGGLFSPQESEFTQFIEETRIADQYLAGTLFNLTTYREKNGEERPISYRDMSVRHLGTLYEGLLEHKLFITQEDTEVRVTKGKIEFIPASQGGKLVQGRFLPEGAVYFGSDPSERKSTGSYYTPEYIVDYITRNTVGEKLKEIKEAFLKQEKGNLSAYSSAVDEDERVALARLLEENALTFVREKILTLSVLDPAMGSGHFLVNVTNLISNFITEFLNEMGITGTADTSPAYWRRWVVENCIYGVDLNPLAVELAKLSLWLLSMAKDQPLSFTNHHLKCGNSLVGARLAEIGNYPFSKSVKEPRQLNMFEKDANFRAAVEDALAKSRLIASHASTTLEDVEEKKAWLAEIENDLDEYKAICDLYTNLYFGSEVSEEEYLDIVESRSFETAKNLIDQVNYFHWELEFPEVFLRSHHGFDVVVGNPPWGRNPDCDDLLQLSLYENIINEDSSEFFIILGLHLLKEDGVEGEVLPDTLLNPSKQKIRRHVISNYYLKSFGNVGPDWFSSDVRMSTILWICFNTYLGTKSYEVQNVILSDEIRRKCISGELLLSDVIQKSSQAIPTSQILSHESALIKTFVGNQDLEILEKIRRHSKRLGDLTERGRGVELNKQGLAVQCRNCSIWNSPPKMNEDGSFGTKKCQSCGETIHVDSSRDNVKNLVQESKNAISDQTRKLYIDGDQINRYGSRAYKFIDTSAEGINYKSDDLYREPKVLLRQAGVGIKAIYDNSGCYCPQSIYVYRVSDIEYRNQGVDELVLLGVLLSRTFHYYLFKEFGEIDSAKAFVKLTHTRIEGLPFPSIPSFVSIDIKRMRELVSDLDGGKLNKNEFVRADWEVEAMVSKLFGIEETDIARLVSEFSKVHENGTLFGLFPDGVRGKEKEIELTWINSLKSVNHD